MAASPERQIQHDHTPGKVMSNALLLLGHNNGSYGAPISEVLFDKPNSKAFEAILHFLLSKVRGAAQAKKVTSANSMSLVRSC